MCILCKVSSFSKIKYWYIGLKTFTDNWNSHTLSIFREFALITGRNAHANETKICQQRFTSRGCISNKITNNY